MGKIEAWDRDRNAYLLVVDVRVEAVVEVEVMLFYELGQVYFLSVMGNQHGQLEVQMQV